MQRHKDFEFNLRELAGSMGDFGTLFPMLAWEGLKMMQPVPLLGVARVRHR